MPFLSHFFAAIAALAAGLINALAGGGTPSPFPPCWRSASTRFSQCDQHRRSLPGFPGGALAQINDLKGQKKRLWIGLTSAILGGLTGAILLLQTTEKLFTNLVPFMILLGATLLAIQTPVRNWLARRQEKRSTSAIPEAWFALPVFLGAIYGGYFGAGYGVILLAILGLFLNDT